MSSADQAQMLQMNRVYGSKVDAAVAVSAALNVTEPSACGLGGYVTSYLRVPCVGM